jgi:hypothetical protein
MGATLSAEQAQAVLDLLALSAGASERGMVLAQEFASADPAMARNYEVHRAVMEALIVIARDIKDDFKGEQSLASLLTRMRPALDKNSAAIVAEFRL